MDLVERFQSREDFHQSIQYGEAMEAIGWSTIPIGQEQIFVRQIGPISFAKFQRPRNVDFSALEKLKKKLHIVQCIIEPKRESAGKLKKHGWHLSSQRYSFSKTAILDLRSTFPEIVARFPSKTRYNAKIAARPVNHYQVFQFHDLNPTELSRFFTLHDAWSKERKIIGFSNIFLQAIVNSFPNKGWVIQATTNENYSGSMMVLMHDRIGYYFYTFTSREGREAHVPTGLTTTALKLCQEHGADIFDFCSIYDPRYPKDNVRWKGFSEFKLRFAPTEIEFPPTYVRWF